MLLFKFSLDEEWILVFFNLTETRKRETSSFRTGKASAIGVHSDFRRLANPLTQGVGIYTVEDLYDEPWDFGLKGFPVTWASRWP